MENNQNNQQNNRRNQGGKGPNKPTVGMVVFAVLTTVFFIFLFYNTMMGDTSLEMKEYTYFLKDLEEGKVESIQITEDGQISVFLKKADFFSLYIIKKEISTIF